MPDWKALHNIYPYEYDRQWGTVYTRKDLDSIFDGSLCSKLTQSELSVLCKVSAVKLTRDQLIGLGTAYKADGLIGDEEAMRRFAALVLLWGYASQGFRVFRVRRILETDETNALGKGTLAAYDAMVKLCPKKVYQAFDEEYKVKWVGEAFFTKILFFLGQIRSNKERFYPIKDAKVSKAAAQVFNDDELKNRSWGAYEKLTACIHDAVAGSGASPELIEQVLFQVPLRDLPGGTAQLMLSLTNAVCQEAEYAADLVSELDPPLICDEKARFYQQGEESTITRILLVSDGEPRHGGLPSPSHNGHVRQLLNGFFSHQRENIIRVGAVKASQCKPPATTYVMTTGYGPIPATISIDLYNVKGDVVVSWHQWQSMYLRSILRMLGRKAVSLVWYAGKSKEKFRDGIWKLILGLMAEHEITLHAIMFGSRQHPTDRWDNLSQYFDSLDLIHQNNQSSVIKLGQLQQNWKQSSIHAKISPFFEFV